jgi:hypothetical protein
MQRAVCFSFTSKDSFPVALNEFVDIDYWTEPGAPWIKHLYSFGHMGFAALLCYNEVRPHQGRWCYGKTPLQTFIDGAPLAREKILDGTQEGLA